MFGPSTKVIAKEFALSVGVASLLKAAPILIGSVFRIPVGMLTDRLGARVVFPIVMLAGSLTAFAVSFATTPAALIAGAFLLGIIGTSFAVGVQSISSATERSRQGYALGIFGAGNVGTAITTLTLPLLLGSLGWRGSFRCMATVVGVGAIAYFVAMSGRGPQRAAAPPSFRTLTAPLGSGRTWLFGLYYMATFGAFVGSVLILSDIYVDVYQISLKTAGVLTTAFSAAASLSRMPGGSLSDRFGAVRVLRTALLATMVLLVPVMVSPPVAVTFACVSLAGIAMGIGSAATFKLIPEYFPQAVGAVGGSVGAIGGVAGFFLPQIAGVLKTSVGVSSQVLPLIMLAAVAAGAMQLSSRKRPESAAETAAGDLTALSNVLSTTSGPVTSPAVESAIEEKT